MEGTTSQVVIGILLCISSLLVYTTYEPFIDDIDDNLTVTAQIQSFLVLFTGLVLRAGVADEDGYNKELLGGVLIFCTICVFIFGFYNFMMHNYIVCKHVLESIKTMKFLQEEGRVHCEEKEEKDEVNKIELLELNRDIVIKESKEVTL